MRLEPGVAQREHVLREVYLVLDGTGIFGVDGRLQSNASGHIGEDDGERNRGRPCTVEQREAKPAEGTFARIDAPRALTADQVNEIERVRAHNAAQRERVRRAAQHRPISHRTLALLVKCETPRELAEWVLGRAASHASVTGYQHTADTAAAMRLYLSALEIQRISKEAAGA